jgi:acid phosphatase
MGLDLLKRYPTFRGSPLSPYRLFSNYYERTIDSARIFARGYLGPNATSLGTVLAINATDPSAVANSLATSDSCPTYNDRSGAGYADVWDEIYLPPIAERLQQFIQGDLVLDSNDVSAFPYLCGFESQILREVSPFCAVFTEQEILQYEYRQDLRYWYGTGPGSFRNTSVMLPVIQGVVDLLKSGPETPVTGAEGSGIEVVGPLSVGFTHDNQINQMVSSLGVFDGQEPLSATSMDEGRIYVSSRNNPMRGTVAFERLSCGGVEKNLRVKLNDAVYRESLPSFLSPFYSLCGASGSGRRAYENALANGVDSYLRLRIRSREVVSVGSVQRRGAGEEVGGGRRV